MFVNLEPELHHKVAALYTKPCVSSLYKLRVNTKAWTHILSVVLLWIKGLDFVYMPCISSVFEHRSHTVLIHKVRWVAAPVWCTSRTQRSNRSYLCQVAFICTNFVIYFLYFDLVWIFCIILVSPPLFAKRFHIGCNCQSYQLQFSLHLGNKCQPLVSIGLMHQAHHLR